MLGTWSLTFTMNDCELHCSIRCDEYVISHFHAMGDSHTTVNMTCIVHIETVNMDFKHSVREERMGMLFEPWQDKSWMRCGAVKEPSIQ